MDSERKNIVAEDLPKLVPILKGLEECVSTVSQSADRTLQSLLDRTSESSEGLSFLDVKNHLILSYLINVTYLMLRKAKGEKIEGEAAIERIVEIRTVLEKMRPTEQKLKYQIDKLMKTAVMGISDKDDPLRFVARPDNLIPKLNDDNTSEEEDDEEAGSDESESGGKKKSGVKLYVPPKVAAVHYDGDLTQKDRQQQRTERNRKRALSSSLMQELHQEYFEGPEEIRDDSRDYKRIKEARERTRYEEDHFVRMPVQKKSRDKNVRNNLRDITEFGSSLALLNDD